MSAQPFSARGGSSASGGVRIGRGGGRGGRLTQSALNAGGGDEDSASATSIPSTTLTRDASTMSAASDASSTQQAHPECLLCCLPISSYVISTCQHSGQICGTCLMKVKLFIRAKKPPQEEAAAAAAASSSADLLNEENDFKPAPPTAEQLEAAETKMNKCPYCHQEWSRVLITKEYDITSNDPRTQPPPTASFGLATDPKYNLNKWLYEPKYNLYFENEQTKSKYFMMTGLYCVLCYNLTDAFAKNGNPNKRYDKVQLFLNQEQLEQHLDQKHQRYLCSACMTTRKIFIHEHQIFTRKELSHHFKYGTNSTTVTEYQPQGQKHTGQIDPHPACIFCERPYFTNDELYVHLMTEHRNCRFCRSEGFDRYFRTDNALRYHFAQKHQLCDEGKCKKLPANNVAFRDVLALKAHKLAAHSEGMSKEEIKKMQTIDLDLFRREPYRKPTSNSFGGGRNREFDEFEFRIDEPPTMSNAEYYAEQFNAQVEDFPTLGVGQSSSSSSSSIPRSTSQPTFGAFGNNRNIHSEEAFPSLGGSSTTTASSSSATSFRGPPPPRDEFPTLRSVVKSEAKFQKKQEEKKQQQQPPKKSVTPTPTAPVTVDTRTVSSVPLPPPIPVHPSDLPARNKAVVANIRAALRDDPEAFEAFKSASQLYRAGDSTAATYLDEFNRLCAHNPRGPVETEKLLMDLISTLPDETQRVSLHGEYARRKIWNQAQQIKKNMKGGNIVSIEANAPDTASKPAKPSKSESKKSTLAPPPSKSPAPAEDVPATSTASKQPTPSPSPPPASSTFASVESKADRKANQAAARKAAAAQGIGAFEGKAVRALKKDEEDEGDFLSTIAKQKEKQEQEQREREQEKERLEAAAAAKKVGPKKGGWSDGSSAAAILAPTATRAGPPGFGSSSSSSTKLVKGNSWTALAGDEDEDGDEPSQISQPIENHHTKSKPHKKPAKQTITTNDDEDDDFNPPLPSLSPAASPGIELPEPSAFSTHLSTIDALRIPEPSKTKLRLMAILFHELQNLIALRHSAINAPANRKFQLSQEARASMMTLIRQTRLSHLWEWTRVARFGLLPNSIQSLNGVIGLHSRFGNDMISDKVAESLTLISSNELFLLVEYVHHVLLQITKSTHPDMKELNASFEKDEQRRQAQNEQFKGKPIRDASSSASSASPAAVFAATPKEDVTSENATTSSNWRNDSASTGPNKKKGKQLLFKYGGM